MGNYITDWDFKKYEAMFNHPMPTNWAGFDIVKFNGILHEHYGYNTAEHGSIVDFCALTWSDGLSNFIVGLLDKTIEPKGNENE